MVARGASGIYPLAATANVPEALRKRWLLRGVGANGDKARVSPALQALVTFRQLNLVAPWPMRGPFDAIFCRNVFIYFERSTQVELIERFAHLLCDGGYLFVGHSESLLNVCERFRPVGRTVYRKVT